MNVVSEGVDFYRKYGFFALSRKAVFFFVHRLIPINVLNATIDRIAFFSAPKPFYLLSAVARDQARDLRKDAMIELVRAHFTQAIRALEIGDWFGEGSTKVWLEHLPANSSLLLIDAWRDYLTKADLETGNRQYRSMHGLAFVALHNMLKIVKSYERSGRNVEIEVVRAPASEFLPKLSSNQFDLIYIDGSHYYPDVIKDIVQAKRLADRKFCVICGDDYELHHTPELLAVAAGNKELDVTVFNNEEFHPGVMLAVAEELGEVNMRAGFWWTFVIDGRVTRERPAAG